MNKIFLGLGGILLLILLSWVYVGSQNNLGPVATSTSTPTGTTTTPPVRAGKVDTGVEGIVTLGPTCPVERIPPDPQCADRPYPTTLVLASTIIGKNGGFLIKTDDKGYFSQELSPGTYTIRAQSQNTLPRLSPVTFTVIQGELTSLNLQFDSGIR